MMTTAQLVRKLLEAGATPDLVEICLTAVEQAREEAAPQPRRRSRARKPELLKGAA